MSHAKSADLPGLDDDPWDGQPERLVYIGFGVITVGLLTAGGCLMAKVPSWADIVWVALILLGALMMLNGANVLRDRTDNLVNATQPEHTNAEARGHRWLPLGQPDTH